MIRVFLLVLVFVTSNLTFSQDNLKRSYYFDVVTISNTKNYSNGFMGKTILFQNQKDSTYSLYMRINNSMREVRLSDRKEKNSISFDMNFEYKSVEDLNKLNNSKLYTVVNYGKSKNYKNYVEEFEFETDSINHKTIIHLTSFKNSKRKKIISEHYYFFGLNDNYDINSPNSIKNYVSETYNLKIADHKHLEKIIHLEDGKISYESNNIIIDLIDFNFEFKIDEVYPKRKTNTPHYNHIQQ
ncbi:hypothetical protein [Hanstruepera ponticola]|uniref:hypothetical protein n=1 Tax=Hanstruepera ponticola TaxID=2042995 RepID=UPI0017814B86|nr:hypothetical protein [Hanstruepera ponticola]